MGRPVSTGEFADICLALQGRGAENINLVTGSHAAPAVAAGLAAARTRGLIIPVLWNSSGYEGLPALELMKDLVDVYLPDLKTRDAALARRYFRAADYPARSAEAIRRMLDYRGTLQFNSRGVLTSGVVIRHLMLPGCGADTRAVIRWFAGHARGRALLSLMTQYTPVKPAPADSPANIGPVNIDPVNIDLDDSAPPVRYIGQGEYDAVLGWLDEFGVEDGFLQEPVQDSSWLPDFSRVNPFSSALSTPVWHWKTGFAVPAGV
jgi:putative pyruvate formate lyase activating enzyme